MRYLARRLAHAALLLIGVSIFSFALLQFAPGDYFSPLGLNPQISARTVAGLRAEYGLDRPLPIRYAAWLGSTLKGDFGVSFAYNSPVGPLLAVRARNTILLTSTAMLLSWLLALPLGIWSAARRGTWGDRVGGLLTSMLLTIPDLVLFLLLLLLAVTASLFSGLYFVGVDGSRGNRAVISLTVRIALSAAVFALLMAGHFLGWSLQ